MCKFCQSDFYLCPGLFPLLRSHAPQFFLSYVVAGLVGVLLFFCMLLGASCAATGFRRIFGHHELSLGFFLKHIEAGLVRRCDYFFVCLGVMFFVGVTQCCHHFFLEVF